VEIFASITATVLVVAAVLGGFVWLALRIRRRGLGGGVLGPVDEIYRPTAHRARIQIEAQQVLAAPGPQADGPDGHIRRSGR
jgi:hypothetical protein